MKKMTKRSGKLSYLIIVDGQTEKWYLDLLKQHEKDRIPRIDIKPEIPKRKKLKELYEQVEENSEIYDMVIWIIDLDVILQQNKINDFKEYYKQLSKRKNVKVLVNNPCLEFWLLLHYKRTSKSFLFCDSVLKELRKYLKNYKKSEKYYKKQNDDIYKKLKGYQETAVTNAQQLGKLDVNNTRQSKAEIYNILEILGIK